MSAKKKPILGPDGKPIDMSKYAPKPEPKASGGRVIASGVDISRDVKDITFVFRQFVSSKPSAPTLPDAVAEQVAALTADFDGEAREELPAPPSDLTTYRDAFASARAKCQHEDAVELLYGREWVCDACHRHLNRDDMRRARGSRPWWLG